MALSRERKVRTNLLFTCPEAIEPADKIVKISRNLIFKTMSSADLLNVACFTLAVVRWLILTANLYQIVIISFHKRPVA
jgi:hypothetical protein